MTNYQRINVDSNTLFAGIVKAILELKNESVFTAVLPYSKSTSTTEQEHNAMHSTRVNSDISYPHSLMSTPVYEIPNDSTSKIVARMSGSFAWDYTLRNLLPNNVDGIMVELRNTCNQTSLFSLVGHDAFYLGVNATKESAYDYMEVARDLSLSTHPNFTTTPGHCRYSLVSNPFCCGIQSIKTCSDLTVHKFFLTTNSTSFQVQHFARATKLTLQRFLPQWLLLPLCWSQQYFSFTTC